MNKSITNPSKYIKTEYGSCTLYPDGYYQVTTYKEGNKGKRLHSLLLKPLLDYLSYKYNGLKFIIHHKNEIKHDNRFENLQITTRENHAFIHNKDTAISKEQKDILFKANFGKKKGLFGGRGYSYSNNYNKRNPYRRVWRSYVYYNSKAKSLGHFEDFVSANLVHELVRNEIFDEREDY